MNPDLPKIEKPVPPVLPLHPEQKTLEKSVAQSVFSEWCTLFGVDIEDIPRDLNPAQKAEKYATVFHSGRQKFLQGFLSQLEGSSLDLSALKLELDSLRESGDVVALGRKEQEIAKTFQDIISAYDYDEVANHPTDVLGRKKMNCLTASLIGGTLLEEVGIRSLLASGGSHTFLVVVTSDNRVLWQDMQDGKEVPEFNNEELTAGKITGKNENGTAIVPLDIASFANNPQHEKLTFIANTAHWKGKSITVEPFSRGIEEQELINTGFRFTNTGRHKEAVEVLEIAQSKSPNVADIYLGLAKALRGLGRYDEAIARCEKALALDPTYSYVEKEMDEIVRLR